MQAVEVAVVYQLRVLHKLAVTAALVQMVAQVQRIEEEVVGAALQMELLLGGMVGLA
jgi:hypothetical protein